jgi:hypothetical protein
MADFDDALVRILEDLIDAIDLRDASDGDVPRWEADARIRRLEADLVDRFRVLHGPRLATIAAESADVGLVGVH